MNNEKLLFSDAIRLAYGQTLMDGGSSMLTTDGCFFTPPEDGFMVGGVSLELKIPKEMLNHNLFHAIWMTYSRMIDDKPNLILHLCNSIAIGTWIDGKDKVVFDLSQQVKTRNEAHDLCIERGEDAYYDVKARKSVSVAEVESEDVELFEKDQEK